MPLAAVQAVALPGNGLSVEVGEFFQGEDFFSLKDESGNPWMIPPRGPMFDVAIECDAPGLTSPNLENFKWTGFQRPIFPLDQETEWTPPDW